MYMVKGHYVWNTHDTARKFLQFYVRPPLPFSLIFAREYYARKIEGEARETERRTWEEFSILGESG